MPAFQYGLCALPVDGALHRGDGTVSARVKAVLAAVRKRGAAVVVATGLSSVAARRVPQDLEGEIDYIVCGNGSHIYRIEHDGPAAGLARKQWIEHAEPLAMPLDTVERIQDLLSEAFPDSIFSANFCPPLNTLGEPTEAVTDIKKAKQILAFSLAPATVETIVADMIESSPVHLASPHPLIQLSIGFPGVEDARTNKLHGDELHGDVRTNAFMEQVKDVLAAADLPGWDDLAVSLPGPHGFVAITPKGITKERALQGLLRQLSPGMTAGNCIAFGDGMNDLGMLAWAGIGVAMENAGSDKVAAAADHVTATNDADGVALVLEQMLAEAAGVHEFREKLLDVAGNTQAVRDPSRSEGTKSSGMLADTDRQGSADLDPTRFRGSGSARALSDVAIDVADGLWGMGTVDEESNTKKRLQEIFSEIDLDGSGTLDRGELAEMFRRSSGGEDDLSESALDTVMAELSAMRHSSTPLPGAADAEEIDFEHFCNWYMKHAEDEHGFMRLVDAKVEFNALRELRAPFIAVGVEYTGLSMLLPILAWRVARAPSLEAARGVTRKGDEGGAGPA